MRLNFLLMAAVLLLIVACETTKETPNGLKFTIVKKGDGILPKPNDIILFNYVFKDATDSVWFNSFKNEFPSPIMIKDSAALPTENGLVQMLRMASKGDSIVAEMSIGDFFKKQLKGSTPAGLDSTVTLYYHLKIVAIMSRDSFEVYQQDWLTKRNLKQLEKELPIIDAYLAGNKIEAITHDSGLRYTIQKEGEGENIKAGQLAKVTYAGYLLDGQFFDSNIKSLAEEKGFYDPRREPYAPLEIIVDESNVIKGWHEALKLMKKGMKATFYMPSTLAYGPQEKSSVIKANSILVFELEVSDVTAKPLADEWTQVTEEEGRTFIYKPCNSAPYSIVIRENQIYIGLGDKVSFGEIKRNRVNGTTTIIEFLDNSDGKTKKVVMKFLDADKKMVRCTLWDFAEEIFVNNAFAQEFEEVQETDCE